MGMGLIFEKWVGLGPKFLDPYLGRPNSWVQTHGSTNLTRDGFSNRQAILDVLKANFDAKSSCNNHLTPF